MARPTSLWIVLDPKDGPEFAAAWREGAHDHIKDCLDEGIHEAARWVVREYTPIAEVERLRAALENVRLLAARHRTEEWAGHMLRFCADAGVTGSPLRGIDAARAAQGGV